MVDADLIWVSHVCNGKNPGSYNGANSIHLGMEASRASPELEDSPSPWGHLASLSTWLSCSGGHLWRQIFEVTSL